MKRASKCYEWLNGLGAFACILPFVFFRLPGGRTQRRILTGALLVFSCLSAAWGQPMPGETIPTASGFSQTNGAWYHGGLQVAPAGVTEFRVINGKPFWKSSNMYYYNSLSSQTPTAWGNAGACTPTGATCFFVYNGGVYYAAGSDYYYNNLSAYAPATQTWGNAGACTPSGATEFEVVGSGVFYKTGTTYYYNNLGIYTSQQWGNSGACTQSGALNFEISGGRPYWNISLTKYINTVSVFTASPQSWGTIETFSGSFPTPDTTYNPCDYAYITSPVAGPATNVGTNQFTANWSAVTGAAGYQLDVSPNNSFTSYVAGYQDLDVGNVLGTNVGGLSPGANYYYRVRAYNSLEASGNSGVINVTTLTLTPPIPVADAASCVGSDNFTANWESAKGATGYELDVSTNSAFTNFVNSYQNLDVGDVLNATVGGLTASTLYYYRVRAYNEYGASGNSSAVSTTTTSPPPALGILWAKSKAVLFWTTNSAASFYLEYATNLSSPQWISNSPLPVIVNGQYRLTNAPANMARFYRLTQPGCE